jgi:PiT family inorganic phosphate transporter
LIFAGAAIAHAGFGVVLGTKQERWWYAFGVLIIVAFIILAPLLGALISYLIYLVA